MSALAFLFADALDHARQRQAVEACLAWERINREIVAASRAGDAAGVARLKPAFWAATIRLRVCGGRR